MGILTKKTSQSMSTERLQRSSSEGCFGMERLFTMKMEKRGTMTQGTLRFVQASQSTLFGTRGD